MMASIKQYIPNFISGVDPETVEFNTLSELLDISFVKIHKDKDFYQYSVSEDRWGTILMAEYNSGIKWWVVGNLPRFTSSFTSSIVGLVSWSPLNHSFS